MTACPQLLTQLHADPRRFGGRLRRVLWAEETLRMLPDDGWAYGWFDGGCLVLADALTSLFSPMAEIVPITRSDHRTGEHYVTRVGRWYLDGAGALPRSSMLRRWQREEVLGPWVACWSTMAEIDISPGTPRDAELSATIAAFLARELVTP